MSPAPAPRARAVRPGGGALRRATAAGALGAVLLLPAIASGHAIVVHQQIARDAGQVWGATPLEVSLHLDGSGPVDPLGAVRYDAGDDIVTGSADEDQEFNYLAHCTVLSFLLTGSGRCAFGPRYTRGFFEHFWDPDQPDAGGPGAYDQGFEDLAVNAGEPLASGYRKAQHLWDTRVICHYLGRDRHGATCPVDPDRSYYWLGRVAHLLQDLTVPAHVHGVRHDPAAALLGDVEPFEAFVEREYERGAGAEYRGLAVLRGGPYAHEALPGLDADGFAWADLHPEATDLFKLFWYTAQKTQYFAAGGAAPGRPGDDGAHRRWGGAGAAQFQPSLWTAEGIEPVAHPLDVPASLPEMASALVPHGLRAVAGLYRLFWHETHAIGLALGGDRLSAGDPLVVTLLNLTGAANTGDLYLAVQTPDGALWVFDGHDWGEAVTAARPGVTLTASPLIAFSTLLTTPVPEGTYTFYAVLVAAGTDPGDPGHWLTNLAQASFVLAAPAIAEGEHRGAPE